jgi:hypothetical protein
VQGGVFFWKNNLLRSDISFLTENTSRHCIDLDPVQLSFATVEKIFGIAGWVFYK